MPPSDANGNADVVSDYQDALKRLAGESDAYELQTLLSTGLELASTPDERDRVLAAAGRQLRKLTTTESGPSHLDRLWLRHIAHEVVFRGPELNDELLATAQMVLRDTVFQIRDAIQEWEAAQRAGEPILDYLRRSPKNASSLRDLTRLVLRLRPAGATALVDAAALDALQSFDRALEQLPGVPPGAIPEWMRVTRDELRAWATEGLAPQVLPALIRRLIRETGSQVTSLHFPAGSGVTSGGWDGLVEADAASLYVPSGVSGWELSTKDKSHEKAMTDFKKRVQSVPSDQRKDMTYVQVICRPWNRRTDFLAEASAGGGFREVRAYNVDDLEAWLEQAPATTVWLKEQLGKPLSGLQTIDDVWRNWLESTTEQLDESVVLAGRQREMDELRSRVAAGSGVTTIGGDVRLEEILAFVGAVAQQEPDTGRLRSTIVVDSDDAARRALEISAPVVVLATSPEYLNYAPPASPHHLVVAVPSGERVDVTLPRIDSSAVTEHFRKRGIEFYEASARGELGRRSLLALRRRLAKQPERHRPGWAKAATREVRRCALLQVWNRRREADQAAVEQLLGATYAEIEERLHRLRYEPDDPFIAMVDDRWHVVSPTDAWLLLSAQITPDDMSHFVDVAVAVLTDVDPVSQLPEEDRWRASLDKVTPSYSSHLRRGIARTVAMFGALESSADYGSGRTSETIAREIVWRALQAANADTSFATWTAVAPHLPLLIEASPVTAIDALRSALAADPPLMHQMFRDQDDTSFGSPRSSPHVQFLWALETLAWAPDYFADAIELLAELAAIDPGGRWSNRPDKSIESILCPWHPNTAATPDQQIHAVSRLRRTHPRLAWGVLLSLLPNAHGSQILARGPEFRSWKAGEPQVLRKDYDQIIIAAARGLIDEAGVDVDRWATLIGEIDNIHRDVQPDLRTALEQLAAALTDEADRRVIWEALRKFLARHREYADAKWALPEAFLSDLDPIARLFEPSDPQSKYGWLFGEGMIELGDLRRRDDYAEYDAELGRRRRDAVAAILAEGGLSGVLAFASQAAFPGQVGAALGSATDATDLDGVLFEWLGTEDTTKSSLAFAYFGSRFRARGWDYLAAFADPESPAATARLLRASFEPLEAAARADELGEEVAQFFWREFTYFGLGHDFDGAIEIARRLADIGRNAAALDLLALYSRHNDSPEFAEAIADALEGLMGNPDGDPDIGALREYDFDLLLRSLAKHRDHLGPERVVRLEWFFLPALGFDPDAPNLHRTLDEDPKFFVEMIKLIYRPSTAGDEDEPRQPTEADKRAAENAFRLLHSWNTCPGTTEDGLLDPSALSEWVREARRLLAEADRQSVGDSEIGQALVAAPADENGSPPAAVKHLIEEVRSEQLDRGFEIRTFNNRGVVSRSLDAGGKMEWKLAEDFRTKADLTRTQWPRVARIFERLAESYEADARREDAEAERRRRGLD